MTAMKKILAVVAAVLGVCLSVNAFAYHRVAKEWVDAEGVKHQELILVPDPPGTKYAPYKLTREQELKADYERKLKEIQEEQRWRDEHNKFVENGTIGKYTNYYNPVTKQSILVDPKTGTIKIDKP